MGSNTTGARMLERIWFFVEQTGGMMRTDKIHQHYINTYDDLPRMADMTQRLLKSGLFKRVGWENRKTGEFTETSLGVKDLVRIGLVNSNLVCVVASKPIEEIIDSYMNNKSTLRKLSRQPSFVKAAVKEAKAVSQ
tara:strand:+ start:1808 stop:2215 length:408 start_codon:yes stop_codon:yes gene_type:complete